MRKVACITLAVLLALSLAAPALACGGKATLVKTGPLSCLPAGVAYVKPVLADLPDGRVVSYSYSGGQVLRDGVPLAWGLSEARFWADLSGARPVAGVDLQARGLRLRAAAAVGPPL